MATYQEIRGLRVKYLSADPSNTATGEVWYNSTTGTLRSHLISAAWSSSSQMILGVGAAAGNSGIQTAAFYAGGTPGVVTQEYNGSGWSLGGNINTERYRLSGAGTLTAGLVFGGQNPANTAMQTATEEYDGTTWTSNPTGLNTARAPVGSAGIQTAALAMGGRTAFSPPYGDVTATEEYNGSAWATSPGSLPQAKIGIAGTGTQSAALAIGGQPTPTTTTTYEYDGSTWSEGGALNTGRHAAGSAGTQTEGLVFGGGTAATEDYDGSTWTTSPATLGTSRDPGGDGPMGTNTAALLAGSPGASLLTEEYNKSANAITAGAWASGGAIPESPAKRDGFYGTVGTVDAGLAYGGEPINTNTWEYDGSTWSPSGAMNTGRRQGGGFGTQAACGNAGGNPTGGAGYSSEYETYNGSTWTVSPYSLTNPRAYCGGAGTTTAGLIFGGGAPPNPTFTATTEEFDGEGWNAGGALPTAKQHGYCGGTQTAAIYAGGQIAPYGAYTLVDTSDTYNGTAWTAAPTMNTAKGIGASAGTQDSFMAATGVYDLSPQK